MYTSIIHSSIKNKSNACNWLLHSKIRSSTKSKSSPSNKNQKSSKHPWIITNYTTWLSIKNISNGLRILRSRKGNNIKENVKSLLMVCFAKKNFRINKQRGLRRRFRAFLTTSSIIPLMTNSLHPRSLKTLKIIYRINWQKKSIGRRLGPNRINSLIKKIRKGLTTSTMKPRWKQN